MKKPHCAPIEDNPIYQQATEYFLDLQSADVSVERIAQWQRWMTADPLHRDAFEKIESTWNELGAAAIEPEVIHDRGDHYDGSTSVSRWRHRHAGTRSLNNRWRRWIEQFRDHQRLMVGAAAAICAVVAIAIFYIPQLISEPPSTTVVETAAGENRDILLADGSKVQVSARSLLWITLSKGSREVTLERGEAFFRVAKDPARPFIVHSGNAAVTAVGTAFNVRRAADRVIVGVAEGIVKVQTTDTIKGKSSAAHPAVSLAQLTAGQQISVERAGITQAVHDVDTHAVAGWREGRLWYMDEPLESVISDLNRYTSRDIDITDPSLRQLHVTATLLEDDVDSWLESLETSFPIRIVRATDGVVKIEKKDSG